MSDYLVVGKKGNGKSLVVVGRMQDALFDGRPVATNLDLHLEHLLRKTNRTARVVRLPDRPTALDLMTLGIGNKSLYFEGDVTGLQPHELADVKIKMKAGYREEDNGVIVLDELATWLNSRTFVDKERQPLLDFFVYSRKLGWDTYFIAQAPNQVDKQLRESLAEYQVICRRLDKLKIPVLGIKLPRVHIATVKYGHEQDALVAERWVYRGNHLFAGYDTTQRFSPNYPHGAHSVLPPGYFPEAVKAPGLLGNLRAWWNGEHCPRNQPLPDRKPHRLVELLQRLPEDQRLKHWQRLSDLGAFA